EALTTGSRAASAVGRKSVMLSGSLATHRSELAELGYTVIPDYIGQTMLDDLRSRVEELFALEGDAAGSEFRAEPNARRLANLVDKGEVFREAIARPEILTLVGS